MVQTSTTESLILYLFNETDMTASVLIQREIDENVEVEIEFEQMKNALEYLDNALINPSAESVNRILEFAASEN